MAKLQQVARYVRSKNAGPFWVTFDIFFSSDEVFARYRNAPALSAAGLAERLGVAASEVQRFEVELLHVLKITIPRATPQGGVIERDLHSGQRYVDLLQMELD